MILSLALWLMSLGAPAPCGPWQPDPGVVIVGDETDSWTLASVVGHDATDLVQELRVALEALPTGTRCHLGTDGSVARDEVRWLVGRLGEACGLECVTGASAGLLPILPYIDSQVLLGKDYHEEAGGRLASGCFATTPIVKTERGRWRVHKTTTIRPKVQPVAQSAPDAVRADAAARRYWGRGRCPYERLVDLIPSMQSHTPPSDVGIALATAEYLAAQRCESAEPDRLALRFELFARGTVNHKPIAWAAEQDIQLRDMRAALGAVERLQRVRPLTAEERSWLPELWARVPLGLRKEQLCLVMRDAAVAPRELSASLALATLLHCPDAIDALAPRAIDMRPEMVQAVRLSVLPQCSAKLDRVLNLP